MAEAVPSATRQRSPAVAQLPGFLFQCRLDFGSGMNTAAVLDSRLPYSVVWMIHPQDARITCTR
jgi:hypothetical protein